MSGMWFFSEPLFDYLRVRSLRQKLIDMFLVISLFTWIAGIYVVAENFSEIKKAWLTQAIDMKSMVALDKSINDVLTLTMINLNADRGSLARFHDTVADVQGKHFVYESRSNEVVQPGVSLVAQLRQNGLISMINIWAQSFVKNQCVYVTSLAQTDQFYEYYRQIGTKADIKCPVLNTSGTLIGYLDFEFTTRATALADMQRMEPTIRDAASKVGAILSVTE
jgi:hypothetical protein